VTNRGRLEIHVFVNNAITTPGYCKYSTEALKQIIIVIINIIIIIFNLQEVELLCSKPELNHCRKTEIL